MAKRTLQVGERVRCAGYYNVGQVVDPMSSHGYVIVKIDGYNTEFHPRDVRRAPVRDDSKED